MQLFQEIPRVVDNFNMNNNTEITNVVKIENFSNSVPNELLVLPDEYIPYNNIFSAEFDNGTCILNFYKKIKNYY